MTQEELSELERIEARIVRMPALCKKFWRRDRSLSIIRGARDKQQAGTRHVSLGSALALARKYLRQGKRACALKRMQAWSVCRAVAVTLWPLMETDLGRQFETELKVVDNFFDYVQEHSLAAWAMVSYRSADHQAMVLELSVAHFKAMKANRLLLGGMGNPFLFPPKHVTRFVQHATSCPPCHRRVALLALAACACFQLKNDALRTAPVEGNHPGKPGLCEKAPFRTPWGQSSPKERKQNKTPCAASSASAGEVLVCVS